MAAETSGINSEQQINVPKIFQGSCNTVSYRKVINGCWPMSLLS